MASYTSVMTAPDGGAGCHHVDYDDPGGTIISKGERWRYGGWVSV